jgi:hypothetical protein
VNPGQGQLDSHASELDGAEPMLRSQQARRFCGRIAAGSGEGAMGRGGAARQRRPPRPFLVIIAIAALKGRDSSLHRSLLTARKVVIG